MSSTLHSRINKIPEKRRKKIQAMADDLIAEELTLRDLRTTLEKTQTELAEKLQVKQEGISRIERRSDMLLSTLINYIRSMGGELELTAKFPNRPSVIIQGFGRPKHKRQKKL